MKRIILIMAALIVGLTVNAQKKRKAFNLKKDMVVQSKSILKKSKKATTARVSLHFKTISKAGTSVGKGQNRRTATSWAILEGISDETLQSITDEFSAMFNKKLNDAGLPTGNYEELTKSERWEKINAKQIKKIKENKAEGLIEIYTANNGPHTKQIIGNPGIWGAYAKLGKSVKSNMITLDIIIDFANFDMSMKKSGYHTTTISANANVFPEIVIKTWNGATGLGTMNTNMTTIGKYGEATIITLKKNIVFDGEFATSVDSYSGKMPARMKKKISWGGGMTTGTFVIKADEVRYKKAVLNALDTYSDYIIQKMKEFRK